MKVEKTDGCWNWTSVMKPNGYGWFIARGRSWSAHRFAWILLHGSIPAGKVIAHACDNRRCVKPAHLWIGTQSENLRDMWSKKRRINNLAKLTSDEIPKIRREAKNKTAKEVARLFGVVPKSIRNILNGITWRTVQ